MQIIIDIPTEKVNKEKVNKDKDIKDMVREMAQKGWISSSALYALYLMSKRCK